MPVRRLCEVEMKKLLLVMALLTPAISLAQSTGSELLTYARQAEPNPNRTIVDAIEAGQWIGFVSGLSRTLHIIDPRTCLPKGSTAGQWGAVIKQYLEQNPAKLHESAVLLAHEALQRAFPCR